MQTIQTLARLTLFIFIIAIAACAPAAAQTNIPIQAPTSTTEPTIAPTLAPTDAPTAAPTTAPTTAPQPTAAPTSGAVDSAIFTANGAFFALSVADVEASSTWYQEKFGLDVILEPPPSNNSTVIVLEGGGLIVELIQNDAAKPLSEVAPAITDKFLVHSITKVGVIVDDFDKTLATLRERGVKIVIGPFPKSANQRENVIIQDNEGNLIQFFGN